MLTRLGSTHSKIFEASELFHLISSNDVSKTKGTDIIVMSRKERGRGVERRGGGERGEERERNLG